MLKKLDAQPWLVAAVTMPVPMTGLERFILLDRITGLKPGSFEEALRRRDLREALLGEGATGWSWDELAQTGLVKARHEEVFQIVLSKADARYLRDFCRTAISADTGGPAVFTILDVHDRLQFILAEA